MIVLFVLEGVEYWYVDVVEGVRIYVVDVGLVDGLVVMLVYGFLQNWWEWCDFIGLLVVDGNWVLCFDLCGVGWSLVFCLWYIKIEMVDDLVVVLDGLGVVKVKLVVYDWGGLVVFIMMLCYFEKVIGFLV